MFDFAQFCFADLTGFEAASSFKYGGYANVFTIEATGEHRTTAYYNGGDVQTSSCHEHTGNNLIAVRDKYQCVKSVTVSNSFYAISYKLAACQRIFHTIVTHCDTIADTNCRELDGSAACLQDTVFNSLSNGIKVHVTGNNFVSCTAYANERFFQFFFSIAHRIEQGAVSCAGRTLFNFNTTHI